MKGLAKFALSAIMAISATTVAAETAGFKFSMFGVNAPDADRVNGVRLAFLYGQPMSHIQGADIGLFAVTEVESVKGAAVSLVNIHRGDDVGANVGLVNITNNVHGANVSFANISEGNTMVDVGVVSFSGKSKVQVGIINCAANGFLPCFPIVNFPK